VTLKGDLCNWDSSPQADVLMIIPPYMLSGSLHSLQDQLCSRYSWIMHVTILGKDLWTLIIIYF